MFSVTRIYKFYFALYILFQQRLKKEQPSIFNQVRKKMFLWFSRKRCWKTILWFSFFSFHLRLLDLFFTRFFVLSDNQSANQPVNALSVYRFVCLSVCLSVYRSVCLSVYRSVCLSVYRSVGWWFCESVSQPVNQSVSRQADQQTVSEAAIHSNLTPVT